MANLQYRGAKVVQQDAVKHDHIASWRGTTYDTSEIEAAPKAQSGSYRGANWKA